MKVTGVITNLLPETSGVSKSGNQWRKKEAIVEYQQGQYPKSIVFSVMGENIDKLNLQQGLEYELELDFETREWNGRYFLSASCWKATAKNNQQPAQEQPTAQQAQPAPQAKPQQQEESSELPF